MTTTITEALAEIKMIGKRLTTKREFVTQYLGRQEGLRDPLDAEGGAPVVLQRERQGIADLEQRIVSIRSAIQKANTETILTIEGVSRSIADWLVWRREVAQGQAAFISKLRQSILAARRDGQQKGFAVRMPGEDAKALSDIIINVDEGGLAREAEALEIILGTLDGKLSLLNATVLIEV